MEFRDNQELQKGICICHIFKCGKIFTSYDKAVSHVRGEHGRDTHNTKKMEKEDIFSHKRNRNDDILQPQSLHSSDKKRKNIGENNIKSTKRASQKRRNFNKKVGIKKKTSRSYKRTKKNRVDDGYYPEAAD